MYRRHWQHVASHLHHLPRLCRFGGSVKFGTLCRDERCSDLFEALGGTLKAAKKRKIVAYDSELLLQGHCDCSSIPGLTYHCQTMCLISLCAQERPCELHRALKGTEPHATLARVACVCAKLEGDHILEQSGTTAYEGLR